jgi:hypothetical protein
MLPHDNSVDYGPSVPCVLLRVIATTSHSRLETPYNWLMSRELKVSCGARGCGRRCCAAEPERQDRTRSHREFRDTGSARKLGCTRRRRHRGRDHPASPPSAGGGCCRAEFLSTTTRMACRSGRRVIQHPRIDSSNARCRSPIIVWGASSSLLLPSPRPSSQPTAPPPPSWRSLCAVRESAPLLARRLRLHHPSGRCPAALQA